MLFNRTSTKPHRTMFWLVGAALIMAALACSVSTDRRETPATLTQIAVDAQADTGDEQEVAEEEATEETTDEEEGDGSVPDEAEGSGAIATDTPTPTPEPGVTPSATPCLYNAKFESDITVPDGTEFVAGESFTKTWRLRNNGCQEWPSGTQLVFLDGNQMSGPAGVPVPQTATQGQQDISVDLVAPNSAGSHQGLWQLRTPDGIAFGDKIYVDIVVIEPSPTPTATFTPSPTATVSGGGGGGIIVVPVFSVNYTATHVTRWSCSGGGRVTFLIANTGNLAIESMKYTMEGPLNILVGQGTTNAPFHPSATVNGGCLVVGSSSLATNSNSYVWLSGQLPSAGIQGRVNFTFCSEDDLGGICTDHSYMFTH